MNIWERFDGLANVTEVREAKENMYEKISAGIYDTTLLSIEPAESRDGNPMLRYKFQNKDGKLIKTSACLSTTARPDLTPMNIARELDFIEKLTGVELTFTSLSALCDELKELPMGGAVRLSVTYKNDTSKYPNFAVLPQEEELPFM